MLPTMAGAANRCVIPEHKFDIERLTELLVADRRKNPSRYSVVLVSEGAMLEGGERSSRRRPPTPSGTRNLAASEILFRRS